MHPRLLEISFGSHGALSVPAFGALLALALGLGLWFSVRRGERRGLPPRALEGALLVATFAGIVVARVAYALLHPAELPPGAALSFQNGGLSGVAGVFAAVGVLLWRLRRADMARAVALDVVAPAFALGVVLARFGCWLEGCDFGKPLAAHAPAWLARLGSFPAHSPAWLAQVRAGSLAPDAVFAAPVQPSELYESAAGVVLFAGALLLGRRRTTPGTTALVVLGGYAALRVAVDLTRAPSPEAWVARAALLLALLFTVSWRWRPA